MDGDGHRYKLKISIENTNSDEESSDSAADDYAGNRRAKRSSENSSDEEISKNKDNDKDETVSVDADTEKTKKTEPKIKTYKNKGEPFCVGFDPTSQECRERQEQRAKRFGDAVSGVTLRDEDIKELYESLGVSPSSDDQEDSDVRYDAIHIHGIDEMSTSRVFDYFGEFAPVAIEWIDDTSCNVVWMDKIMAARAMLKMSREATAEDVISSQAEQKDNDADDGSPTSKEVSERSHKIEESKAMEEDEEDNLDDDDDDINLLSDDDVAKLSRSVVTAEENKAEVEKRQSSVSKDKSKPVREEEEDMDVDDGTLRDTTQPSGDQLPEKTSSALSGDEVNAEHKNVEKTSANKDRNVKMPPGKWRIGVPNSRAKRLFMRFATKADVKLPGAGKRSKYYQKYGNPNFGGMKGLISGSRKRKMFSKKYQEELEEARKVVEEAKWKRGIPDETKFDEHVEDAMIKQKRKRSKDTVELEYSDKDAEDSASELIVEDLNKEERPPQKKRFMKMYADEVEERSLSHRLGPRNDRSSSSSNVRDRLGISTHSLRTSGNSQRRNGTRERSDLRDRLGRR